MKPKIMIIIDQLDIGGAEIFVLDLYKKLCNNFDIYFLALKKSNPKIIAKAEKFAKKVVVLDINVKKPLNIVSKIQDFIEEISPEIVHTHLNYSDIYGRLAAKKSNVVNIFSTVHSPEPWRGKLLSFKGIKTTITDKYLSQNTSKIVCVSKKLKHILVTKQKINPEKISVIYNGIDTNKFKPQKNNQRLLHELNIANNQIIGFVGRLEEPKGLSFLIRAFSKIDNENVLLLIVGGGSLKKDLHDLSKSLEIDDRVIFLGKRSDIVKLLNVFDIFVLPSIWEGLPISLLEAMACKKPVISTQIEGAQEVIKNNKEGLLVPPKDVTSLNKALNELLQDRQKAKLFAKNARKKVLKNFSLERTAREHSKLYNETINNT